MSPQTNAFFVSLVMAWSKKSGFGVKKYDGTLANAALRTFLMINEIGWQNKRGEGRWMKLMQKKKWKIFSKTNNFKIKIGERINGKRSQVKLGNEMNQWF